MKKFLLILVACVGLGVLLNYRHNILNSQNIPANSKEIPLTQPTQRGVNIGEPIKFSIPKLSVESDIEYVGMEPDGRMGDPISPYTVAWWKLGARPGQKGSAVLAGHLDTPQGTPGIFWDLDTLEVGDEIKITDDNGNELDFEVFKKQIYLDSEFPIEEVFGKDDDSYLNLITCEGTFDIESKNYDKRYVVFSKLINN